MLTNRTLVLGSAAVVVVLAALLALGPRPEPQPPSLAERLPVETPRVASVKDYIAALTPKERECFNAAIGGVEVAALEQREATISDAQLASLNACVNAGLPNPAGVLQ